MRNTRFVEKQANIDATHVKMQAFKTAINEVEGPCNLVDTSPIGEMTIGLPMVCEEAPRAHGERVPVHLRLHNGVHDGLCDDGEMEDKIALLYVELVGLVKTQRFGRARKWRGGEDESSSEEEDYRFRNVLPRSRPSKGSCCSTPTPVQNSLRKKVRYSNSSTKKRVAKHQVDVGANDGIEASSLSESSLETSKSTKSFLL